MRYSTMQCLLVAVLLLAACGSAAPATGTNDNGLAPPPPSVPTASSDPAAASTEGSLLAALAAAPVSINQVYFTDWARIKAGENLATLTSASPLDQRHALLMSTTEDQAASSGFAMQKLAKHAEVWGWDTADLDWEAAFISDGPPLYVLKTRADLDLAAIAAKFKQRDFATSSHAEATIYTHAMDLSADWLQASEFAILNTAIVPEKHLLVLSPMIEQVQPALDSIAGTQPSLKENDAALNTAQALGETNAATLLLGNATCSGVDPTSIVGQRAQPEVAEKLRKQLAL